MVCYWALHHPNLYCSRHAGASYTEILSISLASGRAEQLAYLRGLVLIQGNHDDSALYLGRMLMEAGKPNEGFLWNIATHTETPREGGSGLVSPDERLVFGTLLDPESGSRRIRIRPMSGGDWKDLVHLRIANPRSPAPSSISLARDGNWIFYHDVDPGGGDGLYRISTSGGEPERLGDYPSKSPSGTLAISPDGRRIVAVAPEAIDLVAETWLLENFEPKPLAK